MSQLTLYGTPVSQPTRSVSWLLLLKDEPHKYAHVNTVKRETRRPPFVDNFIGGTVPAIDDGGFRLFEGPAVLKYLCDSRGWADWYPTDLQMRSRVEEYLSWHHGNTRKATLSLFRVTLMQLFGLIDDEQAVSELEAGHKEFRLVQKIFARFLERSGGKYLCGDRPTIADLFAYPEFDQLEILGLHRFDGPIRGWLDRMSQLPHHGTIQAPVKKFKASVDKKRAKAKASL